MNHSRSKVWERIPVLVSTTWKIAGEPQSVACLDRAVLEPPLQIVLAGAPVNKKTVLRTCPTPYSP